MKCIHCPDPAEVNMTWLVHIAGKQERTGGNFCGTCAPQVWERVSRVPDAVSSSIIGEPL